MAKKSRTRAAATGRGLHRRAFSPSQFPADGNLAELFAELLAYPNVHGCYIGRKTKKGQPAGELSVICCVHQKLDPKALTRGHRIPTHVTWPRTRSKRYRMRTDVQIAQHGQTRALPPVVGPGDELLPSPAARSGLATLGIALKHPTLGRVITTAGHTFMQGGGTQVFGPNAPVLTINNAGGGAAGSTFQAIPLKASRVPEADYALLQPQAESRNLFRDTLNISGVQFARPEDVGTQLFALTRSDIKQTTLVGVTGTLIFDGVQMTGLLLTEDVTSPGDSGCCLVDASFRVWGLLVGVALVDGVVRSVFASANFVMALENAQLA